jgi:hypothetical protein
LEVPADQEQGPEQAGDDLAWALQHDFKEEWVGLEGLQATSL